MYTGRPEGLPWPSTRRRRLGPPHVATQQSKPASAASNQGPMYPTLRANPYPEVTDPICRIPLSTLFYQLEAVNLGDLLRLSVRPGVKCLLPRIFKGRRGRTGLGRSAELYQPWNPISEQIDFRVTDCKKEKITLSRALADVSWFVYVAVYHPHPGAGILTGFPFDRRREESRNFHTELPYLLGSAHPCPTAVTMEPFSTSVFKVLT